MIKYEFVNNSGPVPFLSFVPLVLAILTGGCAMRVGPKTVALDRFDYSQSISRSQQEQMLLNLVRVRYLEPPFFLDVAQVVAQYSVVGEAQARVADWTSAATGVSGNALGRWTESPTITYSPMTGQRFTKSLLQPVAPITLFSLVQAGWPVDSVMRVGVRAINGLHAGTRTGLLKHAGDPEFARLVELLREIQLAGALGVRVEEAQGLAGGSLAFRGQNPDPAVEVATREAVKILGLAPEAREFRLRFGTVPKDNLEIALLTRSMMEILYESAAGVDIPAADLEEKRATRPLAATPTGTAAQLAITVQSSEHKPPPGAASTEVRYRDHWFYISDRDLPSKGGMSFLMTLFTLVESGAPAAPPVLTLGRP
jgi:hypothetical protein